MLVTCRFCDCRMPRNKRFHSFDFICTHAISQVCNIDKAPTISHTVAQRYHPVSYFCTISVASVLFYSMALIGGGFSNPMSRLDWFYVSSEVIGFLLISLILVFPVSFFESQIFLQAPDLSPFGADQPLEKELGMRPANWYDTVQSGDNRYLSSLKVFNLSGKLSGALHAGCFVLGYILEFASLCVYFRNLPYYPRKW